MSIRKSRSKDIPNQYFVTGREHLHLICELPGGQVVQITVGTGTVDVNGREYVSIGTLFDEKSTVEFKQDIPQSTQLVIRLPKAS